MKNFRTLFIFFTITVKKCDLIWPSVNILKSLSMLQMYLFSSFCLWIKGWCLYDSPQMTALKRSFWRLITSTGSSIKPQSWGTVTSCAALLRSGQITCWASDHWPTVTQKTGRMCFIPPALSKRHPKVKSTA